MIAKFCWTVAVSIVLFASGCGGEGEVSGTITVEGTPVNGLEVAHIPADTSTGGSFLGYPHNGGKYNIIRGRGNRAITVGEYRVTVNLAESNEPQEQTKVKLQNKYSSVGNMDLQANVQSGPNVIAFDLQAQ